MSIYLSEHWKLKDEIKYRIKRHFELKSWKSLNFGIEIGVFYLSIYFLFWSFTVRDNP